MIGQTAGKFAFSGILSRRCLHASTSTSNKAVNTLLTRVNSELKSISDAGLWKHERVITTKQGVLRRTYINYNVSNVNTSF